MRQGAVEVNGLAIVSSILRLPPGKMEVEVRMPTAQGRREGEMPSVKGSQCAWHTVMVTVILPFPLSL